MPKSLGIGLPGTWVFLKGRKMQLALLTGKPEVCQSFFQKLFTPFASWFNPMTLPLLGIVLTADFLLLTVITVSIFFLRHRIWPPPHKNSRQQWVSWALFTVVMFGVPLLGALDFESLGYSHWWHLLMGAIFFLLGLGIDVWRTLTLTAQQSLGSKGKIITAGPYSFTRNPQYLGFIILYAGIIFLTASVMALVTGVFAIFLFFILPFSEEP
jgi:protein-S-isoprenylcysteine O-methyltransferase Ste14